MDTVLVIAGVMMLVVGLGVIFCMSASDIGFVEAAKIWGGAILLTMWIAIGAGLVSLGVGE